MNREILINSLEEFMSETDARLTALEAAKPQAPAASCDEMLDTLLLSNADKRAAIANLTRQRNALIAQCNTLAAQVDDLRNVNAALRIALSDPAPCTGTGSGGCDCLPDDEA